LPDVVHRFKSLATARYRQGVAQNRWPPFPGRLWQRNYYEHIIRGEESLVQIQDYIILNPTRWELDRENPERNDARYTDEEFFRHLLGRSAEQEGEVPHE
jgi:hypothetical protein